MNDNGLKNKIKLELKSFFEKNQIECKEDILELLAKYRPTTIEDIKKITKSTVVVDNASDIIEKIKKIIDKDDISMDENEKEILSKLENRLININKKNRLLFSKKSNKYYIEISKIIDSKENLKEFKRFILNQEKKKELNFSNDDDADDKLKRISKWC